MNDEIEDLRAKLAAAGKRPRGYYRWLAERLLQRHPNLSGGFIAQKALAMDPAANPLTITQTVNALRRERAAIR